MALCNHGPVSHTRREETERREDNMIIGEEKIVWMNELDPACCWELLDTHVVGHVD